MLRLIDLIVQYRHVFLFVFLQYLSLTALVTYNTHQNTAFNAVTGSITRTAQEVNYSWQSYFRLRELNEQLQLENIELRKYNSRLQQEILVYKYRFPFTRAYTVLPDSVMPEDQLVFSSCHVVHNSLLGSYNYLIVDKGRAEGVEPGMGLIAPTGVVGEVIQVGEHHATVISLLNKRFKVNAKIYRRDINGTLTWPGPDLRRAKLEYVPIYHKIALGDTVVTSGYSTLFPEGLVIGQIESIDPREPDGFFDIQIRLNTDFQRLDNVYLVRNIRTAEINRMKANFP